jgi:hypothetical protein
MRLPEACEGWNKEQLGREEAASLLGMSERTFRHSLSRFEEEGEAGLLDKRLNACAAQGVPDNLRATEPDRLEARDTPLIRALTNFYRLTIIPLF